MAYGESYPDSVAPAGAVLAGVLLILTVNGYVNSQHAPRACYDSLSVESIDGSSEVLVTANPLIRLAGSVTLNAVKNADGTLTYEDATGYRDVKWYDTDGNPLDGPRGCVNVKYNEDLIPGENVDVTSTGYADQAQDAVRIAYDRLTAPVSS